ncbi:MAG TPA: choice-of-anchor tandem repeat GloVer-containing protein [Chthonomonadaceae bacterium]|nr:choice-of-anchor tandem repeat GloVer-containing protein [Chthonomonadaceae bacterium]
MSTYSRRQRRQSLGLFLILSLFWIGIASASAWASTLTTLLNLPAPYGSNPVCKLTQGSDGNCYATTWYGGAHGYGAIVKVTPAGKATLLYSFTGGADGGFPLGGVIQANDGNFYGTTFQGGTNDGGVVYKLTPSGTFSVLYTFSGGSIWPINLGGLIQGQDGALYGTTNGGTNGGTVWRLTLSGTLSTLYTFTNGADGDAPWAGVTQGSDGSLYAVSNGGSPNGAGAIVKVSPAGGGTTLHTFDVSTDGGYATEPLVQGGDGNFYGAAQNGGADGHGTLYEITPSGTFTTLYSFTGGSDGSAPEASLVSIGGSFYGSAQYGGSGSGTIFKFTPGTGLTVLVTLGQPGGYHPVGPMLLASDGNLYGTTQGAVSTGNLFKMTTGGSYSVVYTFPAPDGALPYPSLVQGPKGDLYGACNEGGVYGDGTVFQLTPAGAVSVLHSFNLNNTRDGAFPHTGPLTLALDGNFYDTAHLGGADGHGVVYRITTSKKFTDLYSFTGGNDGGDPRGGLVLGLDGNLYGVANTGGAYGKGAVYKIDTSGNETVLYSFTGGSDGANPYESTLILGSDGNFYGVTFNGGFAGDGTVFQITPSGTLTTIYAFTGGADGAHPMGQLCQGTDGAFYGATNIGGANGGGVIYKVTAAGAFTPLHSFTGGADGAYPFSGVIQASDGNFYGVAQFGGAHGDGTIYQITPSGTFTTLYSFSSFSDGNDPSVPPVQATDGNLYGVTVVGGQANIGTIYRLNAGLPVLAISALSPTSVLAGGPSVTLTVKGTGFASGDTVLWNGNALTTTFVSASELKATTPASIPPAIRAGFITVATAAGGVSNRVTLPIALTAVTAKSANLTRNSDGSVTAVVSLKNTGYETAPSVTVTAATLGSKSASNLPVSVGNIAAGATATATINFPNPGVAGTRTKLTVSGTFTGGAFTGKLTVTLP